MPRQNGAKTARQKRRARLDIATRVC